MMVMTIKINFNPRSREGSDNRSCSLCAGYHRFQSTLPRRERLYEFFKPFIDFVFQSTLPRRERLQVLTACWCVSIFQSTLPRRERLSQPLNWTDSIKISIHAPAKGATSLYFLGVSIWAFQSTLPRRERLLCTIHTRIFFFNFNPRSREGSDYEHPFDGYKGQISIHAPAKGATTYFDLMSGLFAISIHAPAKGATR